jgi:hypothetical protein
MLHLINDRTFYGEYFTVGFGCASLVQTIDEVLRALRTVVATRRMFHISFCRVDTHVRATKLRRFQPSLQLPPHLESLQPSFRVTCDQLA